ncbi:MAG: beta-galactosidase trimerization domain-containing protein [Puia sp.]|nr:beta-galactosidase trimerization domain-containing protein [Puia sp.]
MQPRYLPTLLLPLLFFVSCETRSKASASPAPVFTHEEVMQYVPKGPAQCFREISFDANEKKVYSDSLFRLQFSEQDPVKYAEFCEKIHLDGVILQAVPQAGYATYLQTKVNTPYPGMKGDFFGETLKELHKHGISGFGYIGIGWIMKYAQEHPQYTNGDTTHPLICVNSPYREKLIASSREVLNNYPVDGLRYDILDQPAECRCAGCRKLYREMFNDTMPAKWIDWQHQEKFRVESLSRVVRDLYAVCKAVKPSVPVWQNWFNGEDRADISDVNYVDMSYLEFADPFRELFLNGVFDKDGIITGKVIENPETAWKCLALGGRCYSYFASVGKTGLPDGDTSFDRIVPVDWFEKNLAPFYARVHEVQPWLENTRPVTDIAIVYNEKTRYHYDQYDRDDYMKILRGLTEPLLAAGNPIRYISNVNLPATPLESYQALLLPECSGFSDDELAAIKNYADAGGTVIITGDALSYTAGGDPLPDFALGAIMGVSRKEKGPGFRKTGSVSIDSLETGYTRHVIEDGKIPEKSYTLHKSQTRLTPVRATSGQTLSVVIAPGQPAQPFIHLRRYGKGSVYYIASSEMPDIVAAVLNLAGVHSPVTNHNLRAMAVLTRKKDGNEWCLHLLDKGVYSLRIDKKNCPAAKIAATYPADLKDLKITFTKDSILVSVNNPNDYSAILLH